MAVTGIWKVESRLDHVLKYIMDIEKTSDSENLKEVYKSLHNLKDYNNLDFITEEQCFVSGLNCSIDTALSDMNLTKERYNKKDGILAFHAFQAFKEDEVTPELAHKIGMELASEMWGDRFEVVISTHINGKNIHNHFVINSVSFRDGKKYYDNRSSYAELRNISDSLCEEYGLSVLKEKPCKRTKINYGNYSKSFISGNNYYMTTKRDVDIAIAQAYSYEDFEMLLRRMDYEIIYRANKLSLRRVPYKKNIRIERAFGSEYSIEEIKKKIKIEKDIRIPFIEEYGARKRKYNNYPKKKHKGIYALYLYYKYLLNEYPYEKKKRIIPASIRLDIMKMEEFNKEIRYLEENTIKTDEQFFSFKKQREEKLNQLIEERTNLWKEHKKSEDKERILNNINIINKEIYELRKEVKLCEDIKERINSMNQNIEELEKEEMERQKGE